MTTNRELHRFDVTWHRKTVLFARRAVEGVTSRSRKDLQLFHPYYPEGG
jgi:hypothetical protein